MKKWLPLNCINAQCMVRKLYLFPCFFKFCFKGIIFVYSLPKSFTHLRKYKNTMIKSPPNLRIGEASKLIVQAINFTTEVQKSTRWKIANKARSQAALSPWQTKWREVLPHPEFGNSNFWKCFWKEIKIHYKRSLRKVLYKCISWFIECTLTFNFSSAIIRTWCLPTLRYV